MSDQPGHAKFTDPNLVNAWGLARSTDPAATVAVVGRQQRQRHRDALHRRRHRAVAHRVGPRLADGSGVLRRRQIHRLRHARPQRAGALHLRRRGRHRLGVVAGRAAAAAVEAGVRHVRRQRRGRRLQGARHRHRPPRAHAPVRHRLPQRARRRARRRVQRGRARARTRSRTAIGATPCRAAMRRSASRRSAIASSSPTPAGRRRARRRRRPRPRLRRRVPARRRLRAPRGLARGAQFAVGARDGAALVRPLRRRSARRQLRRRQASTASSRTGGAASSSTARCAENTGGRS